MQTIQRSQINDCKFYQYTYQNGSTTLGGWIIYYNKIFYLFDERLKHPVNEINTDIIKEDGEDYVITLKHGRPIRTKTMRQCDIDYAKKVLDRDLKEIEDIQKLEKIEQEEKKQLEQEKKAFEEQKKQLEAQILKTEKPEVVSVVVNETETEKKEPEPKIDKIEIKVEEPTVEKPVAQVVIEAKQTQTQN